MQKLLLLLKYINNLNYNTDFTCQTVSLSHSNHSDVEIVLIGGTWKCFDGLIRSD